METKLHYCQSIKHSCGHSYQNKLIWYLFFRTVDCQKPKTIRRQTQHSHKSLLGSAWRRTFRIPLLSYRSPVQPHMCLQHCNKQQQYSKQQRYNKQLRYKRRHYHRHQQYSKQQRYNKQLRYKRRHYHRHQQYATLHYDHKQHQYSEQLYHKQQQYDTQQPYSL